MSASAARGTGTGARVIVRGPGEGRRVPGREDVVLKATAEDTGGAVGFLEATTAPGPGPSPHVHHDCDELFYVLEGRVRFLVGGRTVEAEAGTFLFVPRGTVHGAENVGTEPGRLLAAFIPGGAEQALEEFARSPPEQRDDLARKYNSEFVGPHR